MRAAQRRRRGRWRRSASGGSAVPTLAACALSWTRSVSIITTHAHDMLRSKARNTFSSLFANLFFSILRVKICYQHCSLHLQPISAEQPQLEGQPRLPLIIRPTGCIAQVLWAGENGQR